MTSQRPQIPIRVKVLIDSREKYPLLFPASLCHFRTNHSSESPHHVLVKTCVRSMPEGDYALEGCESSCLIERKGSGRELCGNLLGSDRQRAVSSLRRLSQATAHPVLLLDTSIRDLMDNWSTGVHPEHTVCSLLQILSTLNITLLSLGPGKTATARRQLGTFILHYLLERSLCQPASFQSEETPTFSGSPEGTP